MLSLLLLSFAVQGGDLKCPVMGGGVAKDTNFVEYRGAKFGFCCGGCDSNFAKAPDKFLATQAKAGNTVGVSMFDVVSRRRIDAAKAPSFSDVGGIRYPFESKDNAMVFLAAQEKLSVAPKKEALYCPVMKQPIASASKAWGYVDHEGVRWYLCCAGCEGPFTKDPASFVTADAKKQIKNVGARILPKE